VIQANRRHEPGKTLSVALSITVHVLLFAFLLFGIRWKTKQPEPVIAELWGALPAVEAPRVQPPPVVTPTPKPEPKLEPEPKVEPKPEPKVEKKPDIALEQERKKKEEERKRLEEEAAEKKRQEEQKRRAEEKKRQEEEQRRFAEESRERMNEQLNRELAAAPKSVAPTVGPPLLGDPRAMAEWQSQIRAKVKPNIVVPSGIVGNPEAIFDVQLMPTGEVLTAKLRKSSGVQAYDDAVERAILKSSPFPLPKNPAVFDRNLRLTFRPLED
jgi:colicin import membrane protein